MAEFTRSCRVGAWTGVLVPAGWCGQGNDFVVRGSCAMMLEVNQPSPVWDHVIPASIMMAG